MTDVRGPSEILLFQSQDGVARVQVRLEDGTVWLSQKGMAELYQVSVVSINEHLSNIYEEQEVAPEATIRKFRIVQTEGKREVSRLVEHYSLETIVAVGYRVRSDRGTLFRRQNSSQPEPMRAKRTWV